MAWQHIGGIMYKTLNSRNNGADQEGGYNMTTRYLPDLTLP